MSLFIKIIDVHAREILDSRGNPTVEVEVTADDLHINDSSFNKNTIYRFEKNVYDRAGI